MSYGKLDNKLFRYSFLHEDSSLLFVKLLIYIIQKITFN